MKIGLNLEKIEQTMKLKLVKLKKLIKDLITLEVARGGTNKYETLANYATEHCKKKNKNVFGMFLMKVIWKDYDTYTTRNNTTCPYTKVCA